MSKISVPVDYISSTRFKYTTVAYESPFLLKKKSLFRAEKIWTENLCSINLSNTQKG